MADNKKILINIEANIRDFKREMMEANRVLKDFSSDFSAFSTKVDTKLDNITNSFNSLSKSVQSLSAPLSVITSHLSQLVSATNTTNTALSTMDARLDAITNEIRGLGTASGSATSSVKSMAAATTSASHAVSNMNASFKNRAIHDFEMSIRNMGRDLRSMANFGGAIPFFQAATWNTAYSVVNAPVRAVQALTSGIKQQIDETASLEGELYDLEAYLGGPGGKAISEFGAKMGATGTDEQTKAAGLQALQNKILQIGQVSPFTAMEIAKATTALAKAGVTIEEIAGSTGTALEAVNLLSQNTGESLDSSAEQLAKLQALNEASLSKTQKQFGQAVDSAAQFQIIVDGLAEADMSSAATASELTQALFNVGGSAQNLNMSFFDTVSLVSSMVPAFESAASAGTSLKYVFSALSGGRSIKAKAAMQKLGLMDEYGQTVFFDEKGFKGLDFMAMQLRETFGDASGMAVDVRNRIITDIFGQDALKAISRLVSMTDEQTEEMLMMSDQLEANAKSGKRAAAEVADIKNEGFEFDMELLRGSLDSIYKTLSMPLMKPFSNVTQTFTGMANAAFAVITSASDVEEQIKTAEKEFIKPSILPNAAKLFSSVLQYSKGLGVVLKQVTSQGWNFQTAGMAMAAVLGTPFGELSSRAKEFEISFKKLHTVIGDLIGDLPSLLNQFINFISSALLSLMNTIQWIKANWEGIVIGFKVLLATMAISRVVTFGNALLGVVTQLKALVGVTAAAGGAGFFTKLSMLLNPGGVAAAAAGGVSPSMGPGGIASAAAGSVSPSRARGGRSGTAAAKRMRAGVAARAAASVAASSASSIIPAAAPVGASLLGSLITPVTHFFSVANLNAIVGRFGTFLGKLVGIVKSPFTIIGLTITAFVVLFQNNINGLRDFIMQRFGFIVVYLKQTFDIIYMAVMDAWNALGGAFTASSKLHFFDGLSNVFKGVFQILEGLVVTFGGVLKIVVGLLTFNGDLIKNGLTDIFESIKIMLVGIVRSALGAVQSLVTGIAEVLDWVGGGGNLGFKVNAFFENLNRNPFFDAGSKTATQYSRGLEYGLKDRTGELKKVTVSFVRDGLTKPVEDTLDMHSPSYVMYRMGYNAMLGFANGITAGSTLVTREMLKVADTVANTDFHISGTGRTINVEQFSPTVQGLGYEELFFQQTGRGIPVMPAAGTVPAFVQAQLPPLTETSKYAPVYYGPQGAPYSGVESNVGRKTWFDSIQKSKTTEYGGFGDFMSNPGKYLVFSSKYRDFIENRGIDPTRDPKAENAKVLIVGLGDRFDYREALSFYQQEQAKMGLTVDTSNIDPFSPRGASLIFKAMMSMPGVNVGDMLGIDNVSNIEQYARTTDFKGARALLQNSYSFPAMKNLQSIQELAPTMQELLKTNDKSVTYQRDTMYKLGYAADYIKRTQQDTQKFVATSEDSFLVQQKAARYAAITARDVTEQPKTSSGRSGGRGAGANTSFVDITTTDAYQKVYQQVYDAAVQNLVNGVQASGPLTAAATQDLASKPGVAPDSKPFSAPFGTYVGQGVYIPSTPEQKMPSRPSDQDMERYYKSIDWYNNQGRYKPVVTERVLSAEEVNAMNPDQAFIPVAQIPQASTFEQLPNLHQFSTESLDVAKTAKGFDISFGERGIKQRGLTKMFENNPELMETYAQVGTRAATFLSLKRGKLTPEDQQLFRKYLAMDRADKKAYLDSVKIAQTELDAIKNDSSLTDKQKAEKSAKVMRDVNAKNEPLTQGFTDVYGLKVGSLTDYQSGNSPVTAEAAKYTDVAMGTISTAISEAAASSDAFKKLPADEQQKLLDSVKNMPLQAMAFLGDAMADGFLDSDEYALFETYVGEDVGLIREIIGRGTGPTAEEKNQAYMPYIEGTAMFAPRENFSGDLAESMFMGWDNTVARMFSTSGVNAMRAFVEGASKENENGKTF